MSPLLLPLHLLLMFAGWLNRHQLQVIEYLQEENRLLKERLGDHLVPSGCAVSPNHVHKLAVGLLVSGGHDRARLSPCRTVYVTAAIDRCEHGLRKVSRFVEHGIRESCRVIVIGASVARRMVVQQPVQREAKFAKGCSIRGSLPK